MVEPRHLAELREPLGALLSWARECGVPLMIIGGVAASLLGKPRTTMDVDAVVWLPDFNEWGAFLAAAERHGLAPRIPDPLGFALGSRVLLMEHRPTGTPLDVSLGALPFEESAIRQAVLTDVGGMRIPLPTPEDFAVLKAIAHRAKDAADIESLLEAHPDIDVAAIVARVREFAEILDAPEIVDDLLRLLPGKASRQTPKKHARAKRRASRR